MPSRRTFARYCSKGVSVALDFPGNTRAQRTWFREIFELAHATHELHFVDASDALCKRQLRDRTRHQPPGTPWTTDSESFLDEHFRPDCDLLVLRTADVLE